MRRFHPERAGGAAAHSSKLRAVIPHLYARRERLPILERNFAPCTLQKPPSAFFLCFSDVYVRPVNLDCLVFVVTYFYSYIGYWNIWTLETFQMLINLKSICLKFR